MNIFCACVKKKCMLNFDKEIIECNINSSIYSSTNSTHTSTSSHMPTRAGTYQLTILVSNSYILLQVAYRFIRAGAEHSIFCLVAPLDPKCALTAALLP